VITVALMSASSAAPLKRFLRMVNTGTPPRSCYWFI
jgi:hypothetical protein